MNTYSVKLWSIVGIIGVFGALCRWVIYLTLEQLLMVSSYIATTIINLTGCFAMGFLLGSLSHHFVSDQGYLKYLSSSFVGSYTTFSTVIADSSILFSGLSLLVPVFLLFCQTFLGLAAFKIARGFGRTINNVSRTHSMKPST